MAENKAKNKTFITSFKEIFTNKQVISSLLITLLLILLFHIGSVITMPGIDIPPEMQPNSADFLGMLNLLSGGGLAKMSLFAVGVGPYITSQIIIQLLSSDLIPPLSKMAKGGERGRRKLEIVTRLLTFPFCVAQAYAIIALVMTNGVVVYGATAIGAIPPEQLIALIVMLTAGTYIAIFIGDLITKRGVGNGITLIILAGILSSLFANFSTALQFIASGITADYAQMITLVLSFSLYVIFFILILLATVFINGSTRKIPIQQTGQGLTSKIENLPFLPIKLNSAGVIPVIFASSLMTIPGTIAQFLPEDEAKWFIMKWLTIESGSGLTIYAIFIILFSFFYSYIQINPSQLAENFEKSGKFIPGIKNGDETEKHITKTLNRVNWIGAPSLAIIAILPYIIAMVTGIPSGVALGGTGIIIMVTATLEFWNSIKSASTTSGYNVTKRNIESKHYQEEQIDEGVSQLW